jgi:3-oxoacyl-[acyl-carrier-protein] synthase-3
MKVYLNKTFFYLPSTILSNDDLARDYNDWDSNKIKLKTGINQRRVADVNETSLDLSVHPSKEALKFLNQNSISIDYLIYVTQTNDFILPGNSTLLLNKLNLSKVPAIDINQACAGYIYGLNIASALIKSGQAKTILLVTSDTYSKIIHKMDKSVRTLFGDGASATIVSNQVLDECINFEIIDFALGSDGKKYDSLYIKDGGFRFPFSKQSLVETIDEKGYTRRPLDLFMNGEEILNFTIEVVPDSINSVLIRNNISIVDVKFFFLHQANKFILNFIGKKMNIIDKLLIDLEDTGNTTSSSIPILLTRNIYKLHFLNNDYVVFCGFGVGLSWGSILLKKV